MSGHASWAMQKANENFEALRQNEYPGRGLVMGRALSGDLVQVYWVMGRSENSRNRLLVAEDSVIKTVPFDASKVDDPSLIIYNAMTQVSKDRTDYHIATNGDQTDTLVQALTTGSTTEEALSSREFEPDAPNYTPRISGIISSEGWGYTFWSTRRNTVTGLPLHRPTVGSFVLKGYGYCLHTYKGDGNPLPSFDADPYLVPIGEELDDTTEMYWQALNGDNRVGLAAKHIVPATGETNYHIINQLA